MDNPAQLLTQVGVMNKISTGHTVLDLLLCMVLPVLLTQIAPHFDRARQWWQVIHLALACQESIVRDRLRCPHGRSLACRCLAPTTPMLPALQAFLLRGSKKWQREISFIRKDGWYYSRDDDEAPNNLLQQVGCSQRRLPDAHAARALCHCWWLA